MSPEGQRIVNDARAALTKIRRVLAETWEPRVLVPHPAQRHLACHVPAILGADVKVIVNELLPLTTSTMTHGG